MPTDHIRTAYLYTAIDCAVGYAQTLAIPSANTNTTRNLLQWIVSTFGPPGEIITDNGSYFIAKIVREYTNTAGIKHGFTMVYHPQTNGIIKFFKGIIKRAIIRSFLAEKIDGVYLTCPIGL